MRIKLMTARNSSTLLLLALCLSMALASAGCSFFSDATPSQSPAKSVSEANQAVTDANDRLVSADKLEQAKNNAKAAKDKAEPLITKAESMRRDTLDSGKDPNDNRQAPNTFKAIEAAKSAQREADQQQKAYDDLLSQNEKAARDLEQAKADLAVAKESEAKGQVTPRSPRSEPTTDSTQFYLSLLSVILSFFTLSLLIISFLLIRKAFGGFQAVANERFERLRKRHDEGLEMLKSVPGGFTDSQERIAGLHSSLRILLDRTAAIDLRLKEGGSGGATGYRSPIAPEAPIEEPQKAVLTFPASTGSILARLNGQEPTLTLNPLRNILERESDGKGELVLLEDSTAPYGQSYVVPNTARFRAREEFFNHYKQFYECDVPKAGEVWVNKPALVIRAGDGWQLHDKGTLEIR